MGSKIVVNNYGSFDVTMAYGKGSTCYDVNGKKSRISSTKHENTCQKNRPKKKCKTNIKKSNTLLKKK